MQITLKRAEIADANKLYQLQLDGFAELLDKYQDFDTNPANESFERAKSRLENDNIDCYFIEYNNESIGYIRIYKLNDNYYRLSQMVVLPEYQGNGYAQQAIQKLENLYPKTINWELDTIMQEPKLCHLYEKMGYKRTGETENIKDGMDIVFYRK